jgi:hypothetical protein
MIKKSIDIVTTFLLIFFVSCSQKNISNNNFFGKDNIDINIINGDDSAISTTTINNDIYKDDDIYHHLNSLYNGHDVFTVDYDLERWEREIVVIEDELLSFFNSNDSTIDNLTTKLPFLNLVVSDNGLVRVYTWDRRMNGGSSGSLEYSSVIQIMDSNDKPKAILIVYLKCDELFTIEESIYLLSGNYYAGHGTSNNNIHAISIINDDIVSYDAFNGKNYLGFSCYHRIELYYNLELLSEYERIVDFDLNCTVKPYTMTFVYTNKITVQENDNLDRFVDLDDFKYSSLEFIWDGEKFVGDYEHLVRIR